MALTMREMVVFILNRFCGLNLELSFRMAEDQSRKDSWIFQSLLTSAKMAPEILGNKGFNRIFCCLFLVN